jgi:hypothetical protein
MFATIEHVAGVGAAVAGIGWVTVVSPAVPHAQPPPIPAGNDITCPGGDVAELQYVPDPADSNAYYVCAGGVLQQHLRCPRPLTKLNINTRPPTCYHVKYAAP